MDLSPRICCCPSAFPSTRSSPIGYVIDCYFGKCPPERNFARFLLFVSYFPQLIQGPINRFDDLATQLYEPHRFDVHNARRALLLVGYGVFKKFAIADVPRLRCLQRTPDSIDASTPGVRHRLRHLSLRHLPVRRFFGRNRHGAGRIAAFRHQDGPQLPSALLLGFDRGFLASLAYHPWRMCATTSSIRWPCARP